MNHKTTSCASRIQTYGKWGTTLWYLFLTDLAVFKEYLVEKIIDICVWFSCMVIATTYVYPAFGMSTQFGEFFAFSIIAGESIWRIWAASSDFIADLEGEKIINSYFVLPLPSWLVVAKASLLHAFKSLIFGPLTLILSKLLLGHKMSFAHLSVAHYILIFLLISIFSGFFFIFLTSFARSVASVDKIGIRILFPLWFFGAAEFPWKMIYEALSPLVAYACLLNPITYVMEGIHVAALGPSGFLNFWLCCGMLAALTTVCGTAGIMRLKKRLDFV